jgi:hypothetical protein
MMRRAVYALFVLLALSTLSCASPLTQVKDDFRAARYGEARETLVRLEPEVPTWSKEKQARYALYRGLVHGALGDRENASVWLRRAKHFVSAEPAIYSEDDAVRLKLALEQLDTAP